MGLLKKIFKKEEKAVQDKIIDREIGYDEGMKIIMDKFFENIALINYSAQDYYRSAEEILKYKELLEEPNLYESLKKTTPGMIKISEDAMEANVKMIDLWIANVIDAVCAVEDVDKNFDYLEMGIKKWAEENVYADVIVKAYGRRPDMDSTVPFELSTVKFLTELAIENKEMGIIIGHGEPLVDVESALDKIAFKILEYYRENIYFTESAIALREKAAEKQRRQIEEETKRDIEKYRKK